MTSFKLSCLAAIRVGESISVPMRWLNTPIHSLTAIVSASTRTVTAENATGDGWRMRSIEVFRNSKPTMQMMSETISPAMYSVRP